MKDEQREDATQTDPPAAAPPAVRGGRESGQSKRRKRAGRNRRRHPARGDDTPKAKSGGASDYPRHPVQKALRIPRAPFRIPQLELACYGQVVGPKEPRARIEGAESG